MRLKMNTVLADVYSSWICPGCFFFACTCTCMYAQPSDHAIMESRFLKIDFNFAIMSSLCTLVLFCAIISVILFILWYIFKLCFNMYFACTFIFKCLSILNPVHCKSTHHGCPSKGEMSLNFG